MAVIVTAARPAETPLHFVGRSSALVRTMLQSVMLWPLVAWFCYPFLSRGAERIPRDPVVFIANHGSHADTAVILRALPPGVRRRTVVAAAEDHFWRIPSLGAFVSLLTGAFPFPRRGCEGLRRAERMLERGYNVLLYPEGTRSNGGRIGEFHQGAAILARRGATIVPIGLYGSADVLPKGSRRPRRRIVSVVFGDPVGSSGAANADGLRTSVDHQARIAHREMEVAGPTFFERFRGFARSPAAVWLTLCWAFLEALVWPVVPDFVILPLVLAAPGRAIALVGAALAGSLAGGGAAYLAGSTWFGGPLLQWAPLVTDPMVEAARQALADGSGGGLLAQPLSGIPYKVFALQAAPAAVDLMDFLAGSAVARGARFAAVALGGALAARLLRPLWERCLLAFLPLYSVSFAAGLGRVVASWQG